MADFLDQIGHQAEKRLWLFSASYKRSIFN